MTRKTRLIRISKCLADQGEATGSAFGRRMSAQVEYWAWIGKAYTEGTGIAIPPPREPPPSTPVAEPLPDSPPKPVPTALETSDALLAMLKKWTERAFSTDPRTSESESERLFQLIAEGEDVAMRINVHSLKSIDDARRFVATHQST